MCREQHNQLVILGNGFDLQCGLKSKYSDFFDGRYNTGGIGRSIQALAKRNSFDKESCISIWDVIFFWLHEIKKSFGKQSQPSDFSWFDIEEIIKQFMTGESDDEKFELGSAIVNIIIYATKYNKNDLGYDFDRADKCVQKIGECISTILRKRYGLADYDPFPEVINKNPQEYKRYFCIDAFIRYLFKELSHFEGEFVKYLEPLSQVDDYQQKFQRNIQNLIKTDSASVRISKTYILSFNYTSLNLPISSGLIYNVHGTINENNIIFGIDGHSAREKASKFTKTFRKMHLKDSFTSIQPNILENINFIKFYGHSLSEADYSYFQSIFDAVSLYESNVKLLFYYTEHDDSSFENERKYQEQSVFDLVNKYGLTFDNKDHGKNLLHKLLLENRLEIKELNFD